MTLPKFQDVIRFPRNINESEFWLTPPDLYAKLDSEFHFDFDPCPYPRPVGYNSLQLSWGKSNYVNPPFRKADGPFGGPTHFARKAISESLSGKSSVLILPVSSYINLLLNAGATIRPLGRVFWINGLTGKQNYHGGHCAVFVLKP